MTRIIDLASEYFAEYLRTVRAGQRVRTDKLVGLANVFVGGQATERSFGDISNIDSRDTDIPQRLRVDTVLKNGVLEPVVVLIEIARL